MDILIKKIIISVESINVIVQKNGIKSIIQLDFENDPGEIKNIFEKYNICSVLDYNFDEKIVRALAIDESGEQIRDYLEICKNVKNGQKNIELAKKMPEIEYDLRSLRNYEC